MTLPTLLKIDKAAFYDFIQKQAEGRFEYERGRIVQQMTGGTLAHMRIVQRFVSTLERQLDPDVWIVTSQGRGVETRETVRYPDVVVEKSGADDKGLATDAPSLVIEVLSRSSEDRDLAVKPAEYTSLPSLHAYIAASQDGPECLVWLRSSALAFPDQPIKIEGRNAKIEIAALGVTFRLSDIYRGIGAGTS